MRVMIEPLIERFGEPLLGAAIGLALGAIFGVLAQRSRFCMRSATIEVWRGTTGDRLPLWLLAVGIAIIGTQWLIGQGIVATDTIRQLNSGGSYSGAVIGGLLFGAGMILTRGCVSRLMVLSASGNLRAVVTIGLFVVVAYATMKGALGPARDLVAGIAPVRGDGGLDLIKITGIGASGGVVFGALVTLAAIVLGARRGLSLAMAAGGIAIGLAVAATYALTALLNAASFDPQPVRGLSFIAPTVNAIAGLVPGGVLKLDFDYGLIPGVFLGAFLAALAARDLKLAWFDSASGTLRYIIGAVLMGFGGVLAGGCSMGNGVSGFAIFAIPALLALVSMWVGAGVADLLVDRRKRIVATTPVSVDLPDAVKA